jgi:hypothetical protein
MYIDVLVVHPQTYVLLVSPHYKPQPTNLETKNLLHMQYLFRNSTILFVCKNKYVQWISPFIDQVLHTALCLSTHIPVSAPTHFSAY